MSLGQKAIERGCLQSRFLRPVARLFGSQQTEHGTDQQCFRQRRPSRRVISVGFHGLRKACDAVADAIGRGELPKVAPWQVKSAGLFTARLPSGNRRLARRSRQLANQQLRKLLHASQILDLAVRRFGPDVGAVPGLHELQDEMESFRMELQASLDDVIGFRRMSHASVSIAIRLGGGLLGFVDYLEAAFLNQNVRQTALDLVGYWRGIGKRIDESERSNFDAALLRRAHPGVGRVAIFEHRYVAALPKNNVNLILPAFVAVVFFQFATQPAGLHAHDRIYARVENLAPVEHLQPDQVLLQPVRLAEEALLDNEL